MLCFNTVDWVSWLSCSVVKNRDCVQGVALFIFLFFMIRIIRCQNYVCLESITPDPIISPMHVTSDEYVFRALTGNQRLLNENLGGAVITMVALLRVLVRKSCRKPLRSPFVWKVIYCKYWINRMLSIRNIFLNRHAFDKNACFLGRSLSKWTATNRWLKDLSDDPDDQ